MAVTWPRASPPPRRRVRSRRRSARDGGINLEPLEWAECLRICAGGAGATALPSARHCAPRHQARQHPAHAQGIVRLGDFGIARDFHHGAGGGLADWDGRHATLHGAGSIEGRAAPNPPTRGHWAWCCGCQPGARAPSAPRACPCSFVPSCSSRSPLASREQGSSGTGGDGDRGGASGDAASSGGNGSRGISSRSLFMTARRRHSTTSRLSCCPRCSVGCFTRVAGALHPRRRARRRSPSAALALQAVAAAQVAAVSSVFTRRSTPGRPGIGRSQPRLWPLIPLVPLVPLSTSSGRSDTGYARRRWKLGASASASAFRGERRTVWVGLNLGQG